MNRIEKTTELFTKGGMNCAQAILTAYGKPYGIDPITARTIGRPLGGGVGVSGQICGFLTAGVHVLAYAFNDSDEGRARKDTHPKVSAFLKKFKDIHGAVTCNELLGIERGTEAGEKKVKAEGLPKKICPAFGRDSAAILEELLLLRRTR